MVDRPLRVGLLVERTRAYGRRVCEGIASYASEHADLAFEMLNWDELRRLRADGPFDAFVVRVLDDEMAARLRALGKPVVDIFGGTRRADFACVDLDNAAIAALAFAHVKERGFANFAYCGYNGVRFSDQRRDAFAAAAQAVGRCFVYATPARIVREFSDEVVRNERYALSTHENARLTKWVRSLPKPVAVFCSHDLRAHQLLKVCLACGISVPTEVAIVGCDNDTILCDLTSPALTSIDPDGFAVGRTAAEVVVRMVCEPCVRRKPPVLLLPPRRIYVRASSEVYPISPAYLSDALVFIRRHCCERISAADVFAHLGRAHTHVEAAFRKVLGTTVQKSIVNARVEAAQHLLAETSLTIAEIARQTGFSSGQYFCRVFRAVRGCAPTSLRSAN